MRSCVKIIVMLGLAAFAFAGHAEGDPAAGKAKSVVCAACHGPDGISSNDLWPNLKGQKYGYIVKQLKALRGGDRTDPMMTPMAKPLSDEDIENLAAYYSSLQ